MRRPLRWVCSQCANWYPFPLPSPLSDPKPLLCYYCLRSSVDRVARRLLASVELA